MRKKLLLLSALFFAVTINAQDTSFEESEGYNLGEISGQNGWDVLSFISPAFTVSDEQASEGSYAFKLDVDQSGIIPDGNLGGATRDISALMPANPDSYELSADMYFDSSSTGGEIDFYIYGGAGTQSLPGAAIAISDERLLIIEYSDFSVAVDMEIQNDTFYNMKMAFDFINQETLYYLDGDLIHTGDLNLSEITGYGFLKTSIGKGYVDNVVTSENTLGTNQIDKEDFTHYINQNNLHLQNNSSLKNILIYNILGQEVISKDLNSKKERINIESLKSGVYIAKVYTHLSTKTFKFIKED